MALLALQIKVTALLAGWEWVAITAADTELLMAWVDTVSTGSLLNGQGKVSVPVFCHRGGKGAGPWAGEGKRGAVVL